jgi:hypothetical protein
MSDYQPVNPADSLPFTMTAGGVIVGGTLVSASADGAVITSTTGDHPIGVAANDTPSGGRVTVWPLPGVVHEITVQGVIALAVPNPVIAGTTGFINTTTLALGGAAGTLIGITTRSGTGGTGSGKARFIGF